MKLRQAALFFWFGLVVGPVAVPLAWVTPARAQCRLCSTPTTTHSDPDRAAVPLRLEVRTSIDFDRLIFTGQGHGGAMLSPDGSRRGTGAVGFVSGRAVAGEVVVRGDPGRAVRVDLPGHIELYGLKGGSLRIDSLTSDLPTNPTLDAAGELHIRIGGELSVQGDVDGEFRGDVPVIVDYI